MAELRPLPLAVHPACQSSYQSLKVEVGRRALWSTRTQSLCGIVPAIVVWKLLPMVFYQYSLVQELVARVTAIYITVSVIRLCFVFINQLKILDTGRRTSIQQYVLSFLGVLRVASVFVGAIVIIAIAIGQNPLKLFAGLGATSAILMLVFKDTIEGLVAGIRLTSANMLHVGDWITVPYGGQRHGDRNEPDDGQSAQLRQYDIHHFAQNPCRRYVPKLERHAGKWRTACQAHHLLRLPQHPLCGRDGTDDRSGSQGQADEATGETDQHGPLPTGR